MTALCDWLRTRLGSFAGRGKEPTRWLGRLVCWACTFGFATGALAGAWTKAPGHGYAKLGSSTFIADHAFDVAGARKDAAPFRLYGQTLYLYNETGIFDGGMLTLLVPYVISRNQHEGGIGFLQSSPGDAQIGGQFRLFQWQDWVGALRLESKIPLYLGGPSLEGRQSSVNPAYPRNSLYFPAIGDGQVDLTTWLSLSASIPWLDGFLTAEGAYRLRMGGISDASLVFLQGGIFLLERRLLCMSNMSAVLTWPAAKDEIVGKGYWTLGISAMLFMTPAWAIEFGVDYLTFGVNTAGGPLMQLGVSYAFGM